jgi:hypothetical protein
MNADGQPRGKRRGVGEEMVLKAGVVPHTQVFFLSSHFAAFGCDRQAEGILGPSSNDSARQGRSENTSSNQSSFVYVTFVTTSMNSKSQHPLSQQKSGDDWRLRGCCSDLPWGNPTASTLFASSAVEMRAPRVQCGPSLISLGGCFYAELDRTPSHESTRLVVAINQT